MGKGEGYDSKSDVGGCEIVSSGRWSEKNWCSLRSWELIRGCTGARGEVVAYVNGEGICGGSPLREGPDVIVEESSFTGGEVLSGLVEGDESTLALLDDGGATLGDLDELKYPPPPGLEKTEYALRAPTAGRSRCARTDIAVDEQRASWWSYRRC